MPQSDLVLRVLGQSKDAIFPTANRALSETFPGKELFETEDPYFQPHQIGEGWTFESSVRPDLWSQFDHSWWVKKDTTYRSPHIGWFDCRWQEKTLLLLRFVVQGDHCPTVRWIIIAENSAEAQGLFETVCRYHSTVRGEILVFQEGTWHGDEELFEAIQGSSLDDIILHADLKEQVKTDITLFFEREAMYQRYKIPWKRGMLFLGPPGNGKTHMIRALTNYFGKPCLYVKSFDAQYRSSQQCVATAFERAREVAPCFLILEDLDSLLTDSTRSFFLNEMDGFASNHGIVTIATCNFPEKLDAAITDRPSRFDRKYHFALPANPDRRRYLERFHLRFDAELQLDDSGLDQIAETTEGYSYAYLKELYVSSAIRWVSTDQHRPIAEVMSDQSATLREQMTTEWAQPAPTNLRSNRYSFPMPPGFDSDDE